MKIFVKIFLSFVWVVFMAAAITLWVAPFSIALAVGLMILGTVFMANLFFESVGRFQLNILRSVGKFLFGGKS